MPSISQRNLNSSSHLRAAARTGKRAQERIGESAGDAAPKALRDRHDIAERARPDGVFRCPEFFEDVLCVLRVVTPRVEKLRLLYSRASKAESAA
jgi:hypothetical protein